VSLCVFVAE